MAWITPAIDTSKDAMVMQKTGGDVFWRRLRGEFPPHDVPYLESGGGGSSRKERRLALVLAYNGRDFKGWQVQLRARTVQGVLEKALSRLCNQPVRVMASGRTDTGVHACGQVAGFSTSSRLDCPSLLSGLQALLPDDIYVRHLGVVPPEFNARYEAKAKTYEYFLRPGTGISVFLQSALWPLKEALSQEAVEEALSLLPGEWDLASLASAPEVKGSTVRRFLQAEMEIGSAGIWRICLTASGFLRHSVRNLVGILVQIGQGRLRPQDLADMLAAGRRIHSGPKAPPGGLYLSRVYYSDFQSRGGKR